MMTRKTVGYVELEWTCDHCGTENPGPRKFCNNCGVKLNENRSNKDGKGKIKLHADIAHPIHADCRKKIQEEVIKAFKQTLENSKALDYKPVEIDEAEDEVPEIVS